MKTYETPEWVAEQAYKNGYAKGYEDGVKEFAERLKKSANRGFWETRDYVETEQIDDLVEEMVGEEDG